MVGIINKPDALNLLGNMNKFVLSSSESILFTLKKGDEILLQQSYEPSPNNLITIDVKEVIDSQLSYVLDPSLPAYVQPNLAASFTVTIDDTDYTFRVIRAGVANLADSAVNWLKLHFLTWQPRIKPVTYYSPEWLTYYAIETCSIQLKATYPDKLTRVISLQNCVAGNATTLNLQYAHIAGLLGNTYPSYYEVYAETKQGIKLSESQYYALSDLLSEDEQWYLFENSLGGLDTFRAGGVNNLKAEHEYNIVQYGEIKEEFQVDTERKYTKNTGYLDDYCRHWLLDFFPSRSKYVYDSTAIRKIVVTESNVTYASNELPSSYTFTWQLAEVSSFLNLIKNEVDIPDNLIIPNLSSPDFTIPPRLIEFPRVQLSEGVLIPAFDPNSKTPSVTTFGAIHNKIKDSVVKELEDELCNIGNGSGSGGSGQNIEIVTTTSLAIPTDDNIFSALRTMVEILKAKEEAEGQFIRKDRTDETDYRVDFHDGITAGHYVGGSLGDGAIIDKDGNAEMTSLKLREFLEVPELRFNRIDVVSGELWNAIAFGLIEEVDEANRIVKLKLEEGELSGMHLNDFCRGIFHNLTDNETAPGVDGSGFDVMVGFRTSYFTPVEIIDNARFKYELKPGTTVHPCKSMKFAVYGNPIDKNRQASAYHTRTYTRYLRGVNTWKIEAKHISMQLGDLSNLVINGESLAEGSVYLNNVYFGGNVWHIPGSEDAMKGNDAYSVTLSTYSAVYNKAEGITETANVVSGDKNILSGDNQVTTSAFRISTRIQVSKGPEPLRYSTTVGKGKYLVSASSIGCSYVITDGMVVVREVTEDKAEVYLEINCEGLAVYEAVFTIVRVIDGADGKDYEYIFRRTETETRPATPATSDQNDFIPPGWTDDPVGPTLTIPFEWVSKRVKFNGQWREFSTPSLWARYSEDGSDHEFIYRRTTVYTTPSTPASSQTDDYVPSGWTDDPVGVDSTYIYEWMSKRDKENETWSAFSTPVLWAKYSFDGKDGDNGVDGRYNEERYKRASSQPGTPSGTNPSGWALDPPLGSDPVWITRATFNSNGTLYRTWSTPVRLTGENGLPGKDGIGSIGPAITNRGTYSSIKQYCGSSERVDVVYSGGYYYMAKPTAGVFSGQPPAADNKYWKRLQGQYESLATGLAIIGEANIASWRFKENYIESQNSNVVLDGTADSGPRIAIGKGYSQRDSAPFRVYESGEFVAEQATIGPFSVGRKTYTNSWYNGGSLVRSNLFARDNIVYKDEKGNTYNRTKSIYLGGTALTMEHTTGESAGEAEGKFGTGRVIIGPSSMDLGGSITVGNTNIPVQTDCSMFIQNRSTRRFQDFGMIVELFNERVDDTNHNKYGREYGRNAFFTGRKRIYSSNGDWYRSIELGSFAFEHESWNHFTYIRMDNMLTNNQSYRVYDTAGNYSLRKVGTAVGSQSPVPLYWDPVSRYMFAKY